MLPLIHALGHVGIVGNERADEIATGFSAKREVSLFEGRFAQYFISQSELEDLSGSPELLSARESARGSKSSSSKPSKNAKPLCYVSSLSGNVQTHPTWAECEARVRGKSGAQYKKVYSESELTVLIKEWGTLDPKKTTKN